MIPVFVGPEYEMLGIHKDALGSGYQFLRKRLLPSFPGERESAEKFRLKKTNQKLLRCWPDGSTAFQLPHLHFSPMSKRYTMLGSVPTNSGWCFFKMISCTPFDPTHWYLGLSDVVVRIAREYSLEGCQLGAFLLERSWI